MASIKTPPAKALPLDALRALEQLKKDGISQAEIARRLDVSDGTVSNALKGKYIGDVDKLAERIRGELLKQTVACPVLGEITSRTCQDERAKPLHFANPLRVRMFRACKACPHNPKGDAE
jgi:DNA-binding XRE family transcriptional regulator